LKWKLITAKPCTFQHHPARIKSHFAIKNESKPCSVQVEKSRQKIYIAYPVWFRPCLKFSQSSYMRVTFVGRMNKHGLLSPPKAAAIIAGWIGNKEDIE